MPSVEDDAEKRCALKSCGLWMGVRNLRKEGCFLIEVAEVEEDWGDLYIYNAEPKRCRDESREFERSECKRRDVHTGRKGLKVTNTAVWLTAVVYLCIELGGVLGWRRLPRRLHSVNGWSGRCFRLAIFGLFLSTSSHTGVTD